MAVLFIAGCSTTTVPVDKTPSPSAQTLDQVRPTDKSPFLAFLVGLVGPESSRSFQQAREEFEKLCVKGELSTNTAASAAVEVLNQALIRPDLTSTERAALEKQRALAKEAFTFHEFVAHTQERTGPGILSADPYVNETALQECLAAIQAITPTFERPGYQIALGQFIISVERQRNEISRHIRELEQEYVSNLTTTQIDWIQQAARNDTNLARNKLAAGRGFFNDNEVLIAEGLRPVVRVLSTSSVHSSIREDAYKVDQEIRSELSDSEIEREMSKPRLPRYEDELNYPGSSEMAKKAWVRSQWNRKMSDSVEITAR